VGANAQCPERELPKVAHFDDLAGVVGKDVEHVLPPATDSSVPVIAALHGDQDGTASTSSSISARNASRSRRPKKAS